MERIPHTETQAEREGRLISSLSKTESITHQEVVQLRLQRLQDVLNYGKTTIQPPKQRKPFNPIKTILSHLIY